jgi:hypothetical protein
MLLLLAACTLSPATQQAFQATVAAVQPSAPVFTATPLPTETPMPTNTPLATFTDTPALPTLNVTPPVETLTPASPDGAPEAIPAQAAALSENVGWTCDDFPCEDDLDGFMRRIQVPPGFLLSHVGRFPGA